VVRQAVAQVIRRRKALAFSGKQISRRLMKEFFISECSQQENKVITSSFVVASKQVKAKKNGEPYLALVLADRTGQIEAKMWDNVEEFISPSSRTTFSRSRA
jgi:DNA polymerase III alpha subunit